jgi:tricorn protease
MIGELNASHSGMGAPRGSAPTDRIGDLGLRFDREAYESRARPDRARGGQSGPGLHRRLDQDRRPDRQRQRQPIEASTNLDALMQNQVGDRVVLGFTNATGRHDAIVRPVGAGTASGLAYRQWVRARRAYVERVSGGRLGYVHMADMSADSLNQLYLDLDSQNQGKERHRHRHPQQQRRVRERLCAGRLLAAATSCT